MCMSEALCIYYQPVNSRYQPNLSWRISKRIRSVLGKVKMPDRTDQQATMAMLQKLSYGADEKLSKKISPKLFQQLDV